MEQISRHVGCTVGDSGKQFWMQWKWKLKLKSHILPTASQHWHVSPEITARGTVHWCRRFGNQRWLWDEERANGGLRDPSKYELSCHGACVSALCLFTSLLCSLPYFLAKENDLGSLCFFICLRCIMSIFLRNPACYNRNDIQKLWINKLTKYTNINVSSFLCRCGWSAKQGF